MNKKIIVLLIIVGLAAFAFYIMNKKSEAPTTSTQETYSNPSYGISFTYPDTYALEEREAGNAERKHYSIVLTDKEELKDIPVDGEGPPTINLDIFQNNLDKQELETWIKNSNNSNFKLSPDSLLSSTTVSGKEAIKYTWDGLYRGESIVTAHKDNILMFSVSYRDIDELIRNDFQRILSSVKFFAFTSSN